MQQYFDHANQEWRVNPKISDRLPDFDSDFANQALRRFFVSALGFELPQPADNIEQGLMWQAYRALAGLPPDDGHHDAEPWHTARL